MMVNEKYVDSVFFLTPSVFRDYPALYSTVSIKITVDCYVSMNKVYLSMFAICTV